MVIRRKGHSWEQRREKDLFVSMADKGRPELPSILIDSDENKVTNVFSTLFKE